MILENSLIRGMIIDYLDHDYFALASLTSVNEVFYRILHQKYNFEIHNLDDPINYVLNHDNLSKITILYKLCHEKCFCIIRTMSYSLFMINAIWIPYELKNIINYPQIYIGVDRYYFSLRPYLILLKLSYYPMALDSSHGMLQDMSFFHYQLGHNCVL